MEIERRTFLGGAAASFAMVGASAEAATGGSYGKFLGPGRATVNVLRVVAGDDGHARFEDMVVQAQRPGQSSLTQFFDRQAHAYAVYSAPAGHTVPERLVLAYAPELIFLADGGATIFTRNESRAVETGTLILFEDAKGTGHTIKAGPAGYMAIKIVLAAK